MSYYHEYILSPVKYGQEHPNRGIPVELPKVSKYTNYVTRGQVYAIGGKSTSGKTSMMDHIYMMNVYLWWRNLKDADGNLIPDEEKPKLKMFYFSMKSRPQIKWQKWVCLYLKLVYNQVMDIPTLTNGVGKMFPLTQEILNMISEATDVFDDFEKDVMTFISGRQTPTTINNRITDYMSTIGSFEDNKFQLDNDHVGQITLVYVDNVNELRVEVDGYSAGNIETSKKKLLNFSTDWRDLYNVTTFMIVPSKVTNSRMVKDSEPTYKELGLFAEKVDIGLVMYNAYNENNNSYLNYPVQEMVINGKNRLRTVSIVRNTGLENITIGLIFMGECGFIKESPHPTEDLEWDRYIDVFRNSGL